ncbi:MULTISPECIES: DUF6614 family protein [unclassified Ruegeria]|uniref:DUF6614 family protein n=1 Tax=unclassified Ruegeria TaxID=2625375 RepID=UPI001489D06B|nr:MULTISPECIES: DUF6614 family protein [unclassified Ruegeria]
MPRLLNQFELKPTVELDAFEQAWNAFVEHLIKTDLAAEGTPLCRRIPASGYDTDELRNHTLMAVVEFRDQSQADAAWAAIKGRVEPLGALHRRVISLVHDPVFTFWSEL